MDSDKQPSPTTTASASDAVISNPLIAQFATIDDLSPDLSSLQDLAAHGSWRAILDKVDSARKLSLLRHPHHHLIYLSFAVLALTKLRRYEAAATELASLDDFDSAEYRYESYPLTYPNRSGSMVPFSLRWLHAEIPIKLGKREETLDRLYVLLDFVRSKLNQKHGSTDLVVSEGVWKRREGFVMNSIVGHHLIAKEGGVCLSLIKDLIDRGHFDALLLSKLGYVQMHVGDLEGAKSSFNRIEGMLKEGEYELLSEKEMKNLVGRNKALMFLVGKDYVSAVREYEECIERDGSDVVAINNKALCLMYLRDLSDSIKVLENALERAPTVALNETLVVNLCSMYELAYVNHSDIKKTLSTWIAQVAPDDFDSSCTRA